MRLEITRRSDLAARALLELASDGDQLKASVLAERIGTTPGFLSQAMTPLVAKGWVRSVPGPAGGYRALVGADDVSVLGVIEAVEGATDTGRCVLEDRPCTPSAPCRAARAVVQRPSPPAVPAGRHPTVEPPPERRPVSAALPAPVAAGGARRSGLRAVAVPSEHGGWGLVAEPGLLGLIIAFSGAGGALAVAAVVAFLARTPLKLVLVDRRRARSLPRTALATRVAAIELTALTVLVVAAVRLSSAPFWWPAVAAAPLVGAQLWFDGRSRSRRLLPELAGAIGVCAVAAMIVLAAGGSSRLAGAAWVVLAARALTSIPHVKDQVLRLHGHATSPARARALLAADVSSLALAAAAVALDRRLLAGAVAVLAVHGVQRVTDRGPLPRPVVLGIRQSLMGLGVVLAAGIGAHLIPA